MSAELVPSKNVRWLFLEKFDTNFCGGVEMKCCHSLVLQILVKGPFSITASQRMVSNLHKRRVG